MVCTSLGSGLIDDEDTVFFSIWNLKRKNKTVHEYFFPMSLSRNTQEKMLCRHTVYVLRQFHKILSGFGINLVLF